MILNEDYKFRDDLFDPKKDGTTCPIEILTQPYTGVVFRFTTVQFKLDEDNIPRLRFAYDLTETKKFSEMKLRQDEYFVKHLGLILNAVLLEMEEMNDIANRTDDHQEPNQE